jgi:hypothetical protein
MSSISADICAVYDVLSVVKLLWESNSVDGKSSPTLALVCPGTNALSGYTFVQMATLTMVRAHRRESATMQTASL